MSQENQSWTKTLLPLGSSIQDAILNLDQSGLQIVLITAADGRLCGTVTDGDVRRALLRGLSLQERADDIMFRSPMVAPPEVGREMVLQLMRANKIHQLPVVDAEHRVVGLHVWDEIIAPSRRDNMMVIMAGGLGKRLRPFTEDCPKPMLPVAGKPMLEHIIDRARAEGSSRFVLSVHYLGHMVEEYFGNGERWQIAIDYLREDHPLGTAGGPCFDALVSRFVGVSCRFACGLATLLHLLFIATFDLIQGYLVLFTQALKFRKILIQVLKLPIILNSIRVPLL